MKLWKGQKFLITTTLKGVSMSPATNITVVGKCKQNGLIITVNTWDTL